MLSVDESLVRAGFRSTRQRRAVYDRLMEINGHPTAEEVFVAVRNRLPRISLATVYKALESLVEAGMARKLMGRGGTAHYESRIENHYHTVCRRCGQIADVEPVDDLEQLIAGMRISSFEVHQARLDFHGHCRRCMN